MTQRRLSLRSRIFIYMILLVVVASILIAGVTIYQYNEQSKDYHKQRLERKEAQILSSISYVLTKTTYPVETQYLDLIFKDEIYAIANNLKVDFNLYDLDGALIKKSKPTFDNDTITPCLSPEILNNLNQTIDKRFVEKDEKIGGDFQSSYTIFTNKESKPLGILNVPYFEDDSFNAAELKEFLFRLGYAYLVMLLVAVAFAYFVSRFITRSLKTISDKMDEIVPALIKVRAQLKPATMDKKNPFFKSKYASLNSIQDCCDKLLCENGLYPFQNVEQQGDNLLPHR